MLGPLRMIGAVGVTGALVRVVRPWAVTLQVSGWPRSAAALVCVAAVPPLDQA